MGNSDHSNPRAQEPATSLTAAAPLWHAFVRDYTNGWPVTDVQAAEGRRPGHDRRVDRRRARAVDAGRARRPGSSTAPSPARRTRSTRTGCSTASPAAATASTWSRPSSGRARGTPTTPTGCAARAAGPASRGQYDSRTAYFWGQSSWGGSIAGSCSAPTRQPTRPGPGPGHGDKPQAQAAASARCPRIPVPGPVGRIGAHACRCRALDGPRDGPRRSASRSSSG